MLKVLGRPSNKEAICPQSGRLIHHSSHCMRKWGEGSPLFLVVLVVAAVHIFLKWMKLPSCRKMAYSKVFKRTSKVNRPRMCAKGLLFPFTEFAGGNCLLKNTAILSAE
jgi:hypothetical protein